AAFLADRLKHEAGETLQAGIERAFWLVLQRDAAPDELAASLDLVRKEGMTVFCRALLNANEFVYLF
ncbi:MAG TPA: hypothetical protein VK633_04230, partial [Verrucomicrobiae bacterium]|nr:hypothetical protein [Verrucomicrobiae bacterium]